MNKGTVKWFNNQKGYGFIKDSEGKEHVYSVTPMEVVKREGDLYTFNAKFSLSNAGDFKVCYRMYPENVDLPHRQDFCYVRWFN